MDGQRYFFVHLQKTAGVSLLWRLRRVFAADEIYPDDSDGDMWREQPQMSVDRLLNRWAVPARRARIRLIAGHFPLATQALLGEDFATFTLLREPVARTRSFLSHYREHHPVWSQRPVQDLYDDPFVHRAIIRNHMTKMLGMSAEESTGGVLTELTLHDEHVERACRNLEHMAAVGLTEDMEGFAQRLETALGWDLGAPIESNRSSPVDLPAELTQRIAEDNALDAQVYAFAARRWGPATNAGSAG